MADKATILIPDISGYTDFTSATELDHSSHIINELLELIIASNQQGFTLSEVEGDAVLFYRKGDPLSKADLVEQCLSMFANFHQQLKVIERDTVCECGACQTASNLTLKFIVHFGDIKEIRVAHFTKATGVDMIVAHRLLKNNVNSREYILISSNCLAQFPDRDSASELIWRDARESYSAIGEVEFAYADLSSARGNIPDPPPREEFIVAKGGDDLEVEIARPIERVYQTLINVDKRIDWIAGIQKVERDPVTERIGMRHECQSQGLTLDITCMDGRLDSDRARYVEHVFVKEMGVGVIDTFDLLSRDGSTLVNMNVNWQAELPREVKDGILQGLKVNLEDLKRLCEGEEE